MYMLPERGCAGERDELIFRENESRWVLLPVEYPSMFKFYKALENQYWTPSPLLWDHQIVRKAVEIMPCLVNVLLDYKLFQGYPQKLPVLDETPLPTPVATAAQPTPSRLSPRDYYELSPISQAAVPPRARKTDKEALQLSRGDRLNAPQSVGDTSPVFLRRLFTDILDLVCEITEYVQSPEARAFLGFELMLQDFHRDATNNALLQILGHHQDTITQEQLVKASVAQVRHCYPKALWLHQHLTGFVGKVKKLAGDKEEDVVMTEYNETEQCASLSEVLICLSVQNILFSAVMSFSGSLVTAASISTDDGSDALSFYFKHVDQDLKMFGDFAAHIYRHLQTTKLPVAVFFGMVTEAMVIENHYLATLFHDPKLELLIHSSNPSAANSSNYRWNTKERIGRLVGALALHVIKACGEKTEEFIQYFTVNETSAVERLNESIYPQLLELQTNSGLNNPSIPLLPFGRLELHDWSAGPENAGMNAGPKLVDFDEEFYTPVEVATDANDATAASSNIFMGDGDF